MGLSGYYLRRMAHPESRTLRKRGQVRAIAFSPDGRILASAGADFAGETSKETRNLVDTPTTTNQTKIIFWQTADGTQLRSISGHTGMVHSLAFSPDGRLLVSGGYDKAVKIWRVEDGKELAVLMGHTNEVTSVAFSPDGKLIASASGSPRTGRSGTHQEIRIAASSEGQHEIRIWDAVTGKLVRQLEGHRDGIPSIAFSPDGTTIASVGLDAVVKVWDAASGNLQKELNASRGRLFSIAFSPDGKTLAFGGSDGFLSFWEPASGRSEHLPTGQGQVFSIAFSPDGKTVATGGYNRTVKLWDFATQSNKETLRSHYGFVWSISFAPDGNHLATGGWDGAIRLWDLTRPVGQQVL